MGKGGRVHRPGVSCGHPFVTTACADYWKSGSDVDANVPHWTCECGTVYHLACLQRRFRTTAASPCVSRVECVTTRCQWCYKDRYDAIGNCTTEVTAPSSQGQEIGKTGEVCDASTASCNTSVDEKAKLVIEIAENLKIHSVDEVTAKNILSFVEGDSVSVDVRGNRNKLIGVCDMKDKSVKRQYSSRMVSRSGFRSTREFATSDYFISKFGPIWHKDTWIRPKLHNMTTKVSRDPQNKSVQIEKHHFRKPHVAIEKRKIELSPLHQNMNTRHCTILPNNLIPLQILLSAQRKPSCKWYTDLVASPFRLSLIVTPDMGIGLYVDSCKRGDILTIYGGMISQTDRSLGPHNNWQLSLKGYRAADLSIDGKDYKMLPWTHWGASVNHAPSASAVNARLDWIPWNSDRPNGPGKELFNVHVPVIIARRDLLGEQVLIEYGSDAAKRMAILSDLQSKS